MLRSDGLQLARVTSTEHPLQVCITDTLAVSHTAQLMIERQVPTTGRSGGGERVAQVIRPVHRVATSVSVRRCDTITGEVAHTTQRATTGRIAIAYSNIYII